MELVRQILQNAEALEFEDGEPYERYLAKTPDEVYQIALMKDAGLVDATIDRTNGIPSAGAIIRLTWAGHDFLDSSRDSKVWKMATEHHPRSVNSGRRGKKPNSYQLKPLLADLRLNRQVELSHV
jgi:hypothetical protein